MKLSARDARAYIARPDRSRAGILIYGQDPMRVADMRKAMTGALTGPNAAEEMRLTRIPAADLRKEPALLLDAVKAQGFFPGPRVALVEDATETVAKAIDAALQDWRDGDAQIVVTAGQLPPKGALRKMFEGHPNAFAIPLYDEPPSADDIADALTAAGLDRPGPDAMAALTALSRKLEPGDFRQTVEKLGLYKRGDPEPLSAEDIAACAPLSVEAALDDILNIAAEGATHEIGPLMSRLAAQGVTPVTLCIGATRHFRQLHTAASDPGGVGQGMGRLRPPVFGPRRDRMGRQASTWGRPRLEKALQILIDTDLQLRSTSRAPAAALMERALIRIAMLNRP
ncbi:DNA polymerase III subunit delta [Aestuariibius sp. 2305UL40-4]|uniref:DNA polymerase III subunit delta n=1 Tax=Aestuariibius violaceus TaxID=3234132 RepID=UPI00345E5B3A